MELNVTAAHAIRDPGTGWWRGGWSETLASGEGHWGVRTPQAQEGQCEGAGGWESQSNPWDLPHKTALHEGRSVNYDECFLNIMLIQRRQLFLDNQQLLLFQSSTFSILRLETQYNGSYLRNKPWLLLIICELLENIVVTLNVVFVCVRGLCRSLWMICLLQSSAPVDLYRWLLSTFLTCWMSRLYNTISQTLRPFTSGKPTGSWHAEAVAKHWQFQRIWVFGEIMVLLI